MKVWIAAIAKMEELYIREWIEWYKQLGVDHIVIGDNNNSNYNKPLQPIIQDYIDSGLVEIINQNDLINFQIDYYNLIYKNRKSEFDWIGFFDIDEFIELPAYNNDIHLFLSDEKFKNTDSIILPWLNYGDDNKLYYENKPVKERFKNPSKQFLEVQFRTGTKYFIKSLEDVTGLWSYHSPLNCEIKNNFKIKCCDSLGNFDFKPVLNSYHSQDFYITEIFINDDYYKNAYISHYLTKSTEEFIKYKILRGRPDRPLDNYEIRYNYGYYYWINSYSEEKNEMFKLYGVLVENDELVEKILNSK